MVKCAFLIIFSSLAAFVFAETAVASRMEGTVVHYYDSLHDAVAAVPAAHEAASGLSIDNPDVIFLLTDITINAPLVIEDGKHIQLVPGNGTRIIMRGHEFIEYPIIWVLGDNASLSLATNGHELIIDGGYLQNPSIISNAPLAAVNGRNSKLIMHDGVFLQNNYNYGPGAGASLHLNGTGVFIRTVDNDMDNLAEFIMKGGVIQGNTNNAQNPIACGGGVYIAGFGLFTMEGGVIRNNTAYLSGGGFHTGSRGSFIKTGGIIYGNDAEEGLRNIAVNGLNTPFVFGHAVCVALVDKPSVQFRDNTVGQNDNLSYLGSATGNGVFGRGEKWYNPRTATQRMLFICISIGLVLALIIFFIVRKKIKKEQLQPEPVLKSIDQINVTFNTQEKNVLELLLKDLSIKMIALELGLTYKGVTYHSKKIYRKLNIKNRTELLLKYRKEERIDN